MSNSTLNKFVLTPVLLSVTVLATLTLPLVFLNKKPVTIQLQEEPVFQGQLRDISTPYLGLASVLSLGAGVAIAAFAGWQNSSRKSSQVEAQLSTLSRNIQEKAAQIQALQSSELYLADPQLSAFLDEAALAKPITTSNQINQSITSSFASIEPTTARPNCKPVPSSTLLPVQEVEQLNSQLQEIMTQMASVQAALSATRTIGNTDQASPHIIKS
jgi:chaperonin cofactor prefoldin